ncbi:unnamed protein product [Musa acuminata subsp. burmannicoides]
MGRKVAPWICRRGGEWDMREGERERWREREREREISLSMLILDGLLLSAVVG